MGEGILLYRSSFHAMLRALERYHSNKAPRFINSMGDQRSTGLALYNVRIWLCRLCGG